VILIPAQDGTDVTLTPGSETQQREQIFSRPQKLTAHLNG